MNTYRQATLKPDSLLDFEMPNLTTKSEDSDENRDTHIENARRRKKGKKSISQKSREKLNKNSRLDTANGGCCSSRSAECTIF